MMSGKDKNLFNKMLDRLNDELRGLPKDIFYWEKDYAQIPLEKRQEFWWVIILRFEYSEHGEFREKHITAYAKYIVQTLKPNEADHQIVLEFLKNRLAKKMLFDEDLSVFLEKQITQFNSSSSI